MLLEARDLTRDFRDGRRTLRVLDGVDLDVRPGQVVTIVGRSGAGKTTLLRVLAGLDRPSRGTVRIDGTGLGTMSARALAALRRRRVGFVFQSCELVPELSAQENVALPLLLDGQATRRALAIARDRLAAVDLADRAEHFPDQLSGGEQHRVALARALVADPELVLADEPTGELDRTTGARILDLLFGCANARTSMVLVTHDAAAAARGSAQLALADGRLRPVG